MQTTIDQMLELLAFFTNTQDGVYVVDTDLKLLVWNEGAERILGYTAAEVLGKPCYQIIGGRDCTGSILCTAACGDMRLAEGHNLVPTRDVLTRTKDGREVWMNVTNIPVPAGLNGLFRLVHIFRDVSATKHAEEFNDRLTGLMEEFAAYQPDHSKSRPMNPAIARLLTPREREVLTLLARGTNTKDIASAMSVSLPTVRKHIQNIFAKLHVHSTLEAVVTAFD